MGSLYHKIKNDKKKDNKSIGDKLYKIKIKPFFKEKILLATDYNYCKYNFFDFNLAEAAKLSTYDIYKLKMINDSFYFAFSKEKTIKILKYDFINKITTEKAIINHIPKKIKYFYDQIQNKEYLFILTKYKGLKTFLIKNEIQYEEEIYKINIKRNDLHDFEIFYDKYNKTNCLIISYTFYEWSGCRRGRIIHMFKLIKNEIVEINKYRASDWSDLNCKRQKLFLIWENKLDKSFYLITSHYLKLKFMEISSNTQEYISDFNIVKSEYLNKYKFHFFGTIIYNKNHTDYLYICNDIDVLKIIDLYKKEIISEIQIMKDITSIINLNSKYIIISTIESIYTFDTNINQVINKYLFKAIGEIISIKKINIDKFLPFNLSFDTTYGNIMIM